MACGGDLGRTVAPHPGVGSMLPRLRCFTAKSKVLDAAISFPGLWPAPHGVLLARRQRTIAFSRPLP